MRLALRHSALGLLLVALTVALVGAGCSNAADDLDAGGTTTSESSAVSTTQFDESITTEDDETTTTRPPPSTTPASTTSTTRPPQTFTNENWGEVVSDPDGHVGDRAEITGELLGVPEVSDGTIAFQMYADVTNRDQVTAVLYAGDDVILVDGAFVRVVGVITGTLSGENAFGASLSNPAVVASSVEVVDATAVTGPALRTVEPVGASSQWDLDIVVDRVDYAVDETRVYVTVVNNSGAKASVYEFNSAAVQGTQQYETQYSSLDYPELPSDILPGIVASAVWTFEPMDPNQATQITIEARTDNYQQDFAPYVFTVPAP